MQGMPQTDSRNFTQDKRKQEQRELYTRQTQTGTKGTLHKTKHKQKQKQEQELNNTIHIGKYCCGTTDSTIPFLI